MQEYETMIPITISGEAPWVPSVHTNSIHNLIDAAMGMTGANVPTLSGNLHIGAETAFRGGKSLAVSNRTSIKDNLPQLDEETYLDALKGKPGENGQFYFDPSDDTSEENCLGMAFHLSMDDCCETLIREYQVEHFIDDLKDEELFGFCQPFDTFAYGLRAMHQLRDEDLQRLRPYLAWCPLEVIQQTIIHTMLFAKDIIWPPMH